MSSEAITKNDLKNVLNEVLPPISPIYLYDHIMFNCTTANSLKYTGVTLTVPANSFYVLMAQAMYNGARPNAVTINTSSSGNGYDEVASGYYAGVMCSCTVVGETTSSDLPLYVWANYATVNSGAGNIYFKGIYIKKRSAE